MKKSKNNKKRKLIFYIPFWIFAVIMFMSVIAIQLDKRNQYLREAAKVQQQVDDQKRQIDALTDQLAYIESDAYIEKIARDQLGLVMPDEIVFVSE